MLRKVTFFSFILLAIVTQSLRAHPSDRDPDRGGLKNLKCTFGRVERAGVALVKDFGPSKVSGLRYGVIVGADTNRTFTWKNQEIDYVNFFAGNCEKNDSFSTVTAVEELFEETGKAIDIPSRSFVSGKDKNYCGYVYSGDNAFRNTPGKNYTQLFFYRMDKASVTNISTAMANCLKNPRLSQRFKENKNACVLSLDDLFKRARHIHNLEVSGKQAQARSDENYIFQTRGNGDGTGRKTVYLDPQYMRNIARDISRDSNNIPKIYASLTTPQRPANPIPAKQPVNPKSGTKPSVPVKNPVSGKPVGKPVVPVKQPVNPKLAAKPSVPVKNPVSGKPVGKPVVPVKQPVNSKSGAKPSGPVKNPASGKPVGKPVVPAKQPLKEAAAGKSKASVVSTKK